MGFSRQEYWNRLPFSTPEDLPSSGIEPSTQSLVSPVLAGRFFTTAPPGKSGIVIVVSKGDATPFFSMILLFIAGLEAPIKSASGENWHDGVLELHLYCKGLEHIGVLLPPPPHSSSSPFFLVHQVPTPLDHFQCVIMSVILKTTTLLTPYSPFSYCLKSLLALSQNF